MRDFPTDHDLRPPGWGRDLLDAGEVLFQHFLFAAQKRNRPSAAYECEAQIVKGLDQGV